MARIGTVFVELSLDDRVYKQKLSETLTSTQTKCGKGSVPLIRTFLYLKSIAPVSVRQASAYGPW